MNVFSLGKYKAIVIALGAFVGLIAGVMALNFMISTQLADDAVGINVAGRQRMLTQRLVKEALELKEAIVAGKDVTEAFEALGGTMTLFESTLRALQVGGTATASDGTLINLQAAATPRSQEILEASAQLWEPYNTLLDDALSNATDASGFERLAESIAYGREHNLTLLTLMNAFVTDLERLAISKVTRLRYIQAAAITLALAYFFVIFFRFIRQLRQSDAMTEKARQETENILHTVQEGLFLLDSEYKIGSQFSRATQTIFANKKLDGTALQDLLGDVVTERDLQLTEDYVSLLFGDRVNENLVADINPLNQVEVNLAQDDGQYDTKYLAFNFNRVRVDNKLSHLLVTVNDISERIKLKQELDEVKEKSQDQLNMLINILHVEKSALGAFLGDTEVALRDINDIFKQPKSNSVSSKY